MAWQLLPWLSFTGQYTVEGILVRQYDALSALLATSSVDITRLRFPTGNYILQTISPGFTLDFRDNPINPHKGILFTTVGELTNDISAESTDAFGNNPVPAVIYTWKMSAGITGLRSSQRPRRLGPLRPRWTDLGFGEGWGDYCSPALLLGRSEYAPRVSGGRCHPSG